MSSFFEKKQKTNNRSETRNNFFPRKSSVKHSIEAASMRLQCSTLSALICLAEFNTKSQSDEETARPFSGFEMQPANKHPDSCTYAASFTHWLLSRKCCL